jgi:hypothetical protein
MVGWLAREYLGQGGRRGTSQARDNADRIAALCLTLLNFVQLGRRV